MNKIKEIAAVIVSVAFLFAGGSLLWFGVMAAYGHNSAMTAVCIAGAILLLFAATIDRFESVKGLGVEAKTRRLDEKLVEADLAIDQLRQLAETLGTESVAANSKLGRLDSAPTAEESYMHAQAVRSVMVKLGTKPEVIRSMLRPFVHMMLFDLTTAILHPVHRNIQHNLQQAAKDRKNVPLNSEEEAKASALRSEAYEFDRAMHKNLYKSLSIEDYPTEVLGRLSRVPLLDQEVKEAAQNEVIRFSGDMLLLRQEGVLTNPEDWFRTLSAHRNRDRFA